MPTKEYALFCEFATLSVNGLQTYVNIFDRTAFKPGVSMGLRGFFAAKFAGIDGQVKCEMYVTDANNTLLEGGKVFDDSLKGPAATIVARVPNLPVKEAGEYRVWARMDGGEPMLLCAWKAEVRA